MIKIYNSKCNKRKHKIIKNILRQGLKHYENILPNIKITIYDYENGTNWTGIYKNKKISKLIDLNLKELLQLYKNPNTLNRIKRDHLKILKNFRQFLLFAVYHEIGHYKQKEYFNTRFNKRIKELRADYFSLRVLKKIGVIDEYK